MRLTYRTPFSSEYCCLFPVCEGPVVNESVPQDRKARARRYRDNVPMIAGGSNVIAREFPHMVSLSAKTPTPPSFLWIFLTTAFPLCLSLSLCPLLLSFYYPAFISSPVSSLSFSFLSLPFLFSILLSHYFLFCSFFPVRFVCLFFVPLPHSYYVLVSLIISAWSTRLFPLQHDNLKCILIFNALFPVLDVSLACVNLLDKIRCCSYIYHYKIYHVADKPNKIFTETNYFIYLNNRSLNYVTFNGVFWRNLMTFDSKCEVCNRSLRVEIKSDIQILFQTPITVCHANPFSSSAEGRYWQTLQLRVYFKRFLSTEHKTACMLFRLL
jgi:hypothetical protein